MSSVFDSILDWLNRPGEQPSENVSPWSGSNPFYQPPASAFPVVSSAASGEAKPSGLNFPNGDAEFLKGLIKLASPAGAGMAITDSLGLKHDSSLDFKIGFLNRRVPLFYLRVSLALRGGSLRRVGRALILREGLFLMLMGS
jgi:hypothetical protein